MTLLKSLDLDPEFKIKPNLMIAPLPNLKNSASKLPVAELEKLGFQVGHHGT